MSETKKRKRIKIHHWMVIAFYLVIYDALAVNLSYFAGLMLRFDFKYSAIPEEYLTAWIMFVPFYTVICFTVFCFMRLYNSMWRFASFNELNRCFGASVITSVIHTIGITVFFHRMPISYYLIGAVLQLAAITIVRFVYRYVNLIRSKRAQNANAKYNVMVIGAGEAGKTIIKELQVSERMDTKVKCVIDDNSNKWGRYMEGVPIFGGRDAIMSAVEKFGIDQIMFAIPSAKPEQKRDILNICKETGCELKSLPGIYQLATGEVSLSKMKNVEVEELLGRDVIKVDLEHITNYIQEKVILVTGGGGSIGSELCRQIAAHEPKQLIIFDVYENSAYEIEQELKRKYGKKLNLTVLIGSVRDSKRVEMVFDKYKPQLVFHAAAHKHVPLMETSPNEAIKNNAIGTYKVAYNALKYNAERFVLISTDKAVNPTNIMGASKRLCEMIIQSMDAVSREGKFDLLPRLGAHDACRTQGMIAAEDGVRMGGIKVESVSNQERKGTQFVAVRFGNVLGSNGSVIPLFKKQIEAGGPVTVTHPDIVRYFMTIPEAVSLVLQAGASAWGGEIFVLDMGEQVKIDTLARNLIKLSGLVPDEDIKIEYSGLRPGEKLYEERLMAEEGIKPTENEKIHVGKPIPFEVDVFLKQLEELADMSYNNSDDIVDMVAGIVTTFTPVGEHKNEQ